MVGFLLILVVENLAHKIADHKSKAEIKTQDNQGEDDEDAMADTPTGMKLKISGISGQGDVNMNNNNCQDDHLTISVPTPSFKPPPSASPCFSSKKVKLIKVSNDKISRIYFSVCIKERKPPFTRETFFLQLLHRLHCGERDHQ